MPGKVWTEAQEEHLLRRRAEGASLIDVAAELGLPLMGVRHKSARLNAGTVPRTRSWGKVAERRLRALYPGAPWSELQSAFPGRTRKTIRDKAARLGVTRFRVMDAIEELERISALTEMDAAYLAGLIDGEGTIWFPSARRGSLSLGSTSWPVIDFLEDKVGGRSYEYLNGTGLGKLPFRRWHLSKHRAVLALLDRMAPYMIIKREQAEKAMRLRE